jgi:Icc-related predicted phosphoesterase
VKVLAFTDPHGGTEAADAVISLAKSVRPDVVVCSGDISYFQMRYERMCRRLADLGCPVYWVSGNHDAGIEDLVGVEFPHMKDVSFLVADLQRATIGGVPGSEKFWPSKEWDDELVTLAIRTYGRVPRSKPFVFLSHFPPRGSSIDGHSGGSPDAGGSQTVREMVDALQPDLVISGHYHSDFRRECRIGKVRCVNPGAMGSVYEV